MQKIVINRRIGGFSLSKKAAEELHLSEADFMEIFGETLESLQEWGDSTACRLERDDPRLVEIVQRLGLEADGEQSHLVVVDDVPDGVQWTVEEGEDGIEWVAEVHRTWVGHDDKFIDYEWGGGNDDDTSSP